MITSALLRTETERGERNVLSLVQRGLVGGFLVRLSMTCMRSLLLSGVAVLSHTGTM